MEKIIYKLIFIALIPSITILVVLGIFVFTPLVHADGISDFNSISTELTNHGVLNNLSEVTVDNVASFSGLYFRRETQGKIEFLDTVDLSDSSTQTFIQSFISSSSPLQFSTGKIYFNVSGSVFVNKKAKISFYRINGYLPTYLDFDSITASEILSHVVAKGDNGLIFTSTFENSFYSIENDIDGENHIFSFDIPHFSSYELDFSYPSIVAPDAITMEATGILTSVNLGIPTISDSVDPSPKIVMTIPDVADPSLPMVITNPYDFPLGLTTVTWTATNAVGNSAMAQQDVTVTDYTSPVITPQSDIVVDATSTDGAIVNFKIPTAFDLVAGEREVICDHDSGIIFPIGTTLITCSTNDISNNFISSIFSIVVQYKFAPTIKIKGDSSVNIEVGALYVDEGATAYDESEGDVSNRIVVSNNVDTSVVGEYLVTYDATNTHGNSAIQKIRIVHVFDPAVIKEEIVAEGRHNGGGPLFINKPNTSIGKVLGAETFNFTLTLREGSRGNEVLELQKFLNNASYNCGREDGIFGPLTKAAVVRFQIANGIMNGFGTVGPITRAALNRK